MNEPPHNSPSPSRSAAGYRKAVGDEPLPGYRLVGTLGKGGFGEVWECEAPGGLRKAAKFVFEDAGEAGGGNTFAQEFDSFQKIKSIRHPFVLTLERVERIDGQLIMVMELADQTLADRFDECRIRGLAGVPRDELLGYLADVAEGLDVIGGKHALQHLDVKPANLFLLGGRAKVGDFGLVRSQQAAKAASDRGLTPRYVAPEVVRGQIDHRSDQYSLALVYQELLTGTFPYECKSPAHMLLQHATATPDLRGLPPQDRGPVGRALAKAPTDRWDTCTAFVEGLLEAADQSSSEDAMQPARGSSLLLRRTRRTRAAADHTPAPRTPPPDRPAVPLPDPDHLSTTDTTSQPPAPPLHSTTVDVIDLVRTPPAVADRADHPTVPSPRPGTSPALPRSRPDGGLFRPSFPELTTPPYAATPSANGGVQLSQVPSIVPVSLLTGGRVDSNYRPNPAEFCEALVRAAAPGGSLPPAPGGLARTADGFECRFPVRLMAGMLALKVAALRETWRCDLTWPNEQTAVLFIGGPTGLFSRLAGRKSGAEITVRFPDGRKAVGEATITARLVGQPDPSVAQPLTKLLDDARGILANQPEHRATVRVAAAFPVRLFPVTSDGIVSSPIRARARNVSTGGVGLDLEAGDTPRGHAYTAFADAGAATDWAVLTRIIWTATDRGRTTVAGKFRTHRR